MRRWTYYLLWAILLGGLIPPRALARGVHPHPLSVGQERPLATILAEMEQKYGVIFTYDARLIGQYHLHFEFRERETFDQAVNRLLAHVGLTYEHLGSRYYVIYESSRRGQIAVRRIRRKTLQLQRLEEASGLTIQKLHGEGQEAIEGIIQHLADHPVRLDVQGQVRSGDGTPLIGAVVREKGTPNGTLTDENGRFRLSVASDKAVLVISYFGYITQEVAVAGQPSFDIVMLPSETSLEEVVVIGYGQVKKKDLIGSVDQINSEKIENLPVTSFDLALAGQAAGVQFRQGTGQPGAGAEILIRGVGSISAGNQPLIVIDGLPFGNYNGQTDNLLALLDPNDIESISIVRDASGKAIYGSRAANGLILITTKRGTTDQKPTIEFNSYVGLQTILDFERPNVLRADELAQFLRERIEDQAVVNGTTPTIPAHLEDPSSYGAGTDWFDAITRDAWMHNVNLNLRGGTKDLRYAIGMGFMNQDGVIIETNLKRYSLRANIDADITPWLRLNLEVAPSWTSNASGNTDPGGGQFSVYNVVNIAQWADPSAPLYDDNGELTPTTQGALLPFFQANPVYKLRNQINQRDNRQLLLGATLGATLAPGLELKTYLGTNVLNNASRAFSPGSVVGQGLTPFNPDPPANSNARAGRYESLRLVSTTTLGYQRSLAGGKHQIDAILGQSAEYQQETFFNAGGSRLIDENFTYFTSGNIAVNLPSNPDETRIFFSAGEGRSEQALLSYFGRLSYTFANRYILTATVRTDGSSRFGPNNRYATFPSAGLAWRVSEEPWFPKTNLLTNLRLEGSWGRSGNNRIGNYAWQGLVSTSGDYVLGGGRVEGAFLSDIPNPNLSWEETEQVDLGIDLSLFDNRLDLGVDLFDQQTEDLLYNAPLPTLTGFGSYLTNLGAIQNRGIEITAGGRPIRRSHVTWRIDANMSFIRNKVLQLGQDDLPIRGTFAGNGTPVSWTQVGQPVGQYYGLEILGLYTPEMLDDPSIPRYPGAVAGSPYYTDGDGDGQLESLDDYVFIGNPWPTFTYGMTHLVRWRDFELRLIMAGEVGSHIMDLQREFMLNTDGVFNMRREVLDRWRPGDTDYSLRPPTTTSAASSQRYRWPNNLAVIDGTYLKVNNVTLTYNYGRILAAKGTLRGGSIFLSIQNALVLAHFQGNPEVRRAATGSLERNINYGSYPVPRTFTLGLNMSL